jgi:hypothetical protein
MKKIDCWDDMRAHGVDALTGEACGYAMRLLCDVTEDGRDLIQRFLGGTVAIQPASNWNGGSANDPHVGSILLPRSILPELAAFTLLYTTSETAIVTFSDGRVASLDAERFQRYQELDAERDDDSKFPRMIDRVWRRPTETSSERNRHAMSGRVS